MKRILSLFLAAATIFGMLAFPAEVSAQTVHTHETEIQEASPFAMEGFFSLFGRKIHRHEYVTKVIAPTCERKGYTLRSCACGHSVIRHTTPALGHEWGPWEMVRAAKEDQPGEKIRTCAVCGKTQTRMTFVGHHKHHYETKVIKPTCKTRGYLLHECDCGAHYATNYKKRLGHDWEPWKVLKAPTETTTGLKERTCRKCGRVQQDFIQVSAHVHSYEETVIAPTCTEKGYTLHTCLCGDSFKDTYTEPLGHSYGPWEVTKVPTETQKGLQIRTCTRCSNQQKKVLPKAPHTHSYEQKVVAPTCTEQGYTLYTCKCGHSYKGNLTDALGHSFSDWTVVKSGKKVTEVRVCSRCGIRETRPHTHAFSKEIIAPTCTEKGYTLKSCVCGAKQKVNYVPALGHDLGEWVVTKPATEEAVGQETRSCSRCDFKETREIPKLEHTHKFRFIKTVKPTCTEKGYDLYTCSVCHAEEKRNLKDVIPHTFKDTVVKKTCTTEGYTLHKCSVCGFEEKSDFVPASHNWSEWDYIHSGNKVMEGHHCLDCGKKESVKHIHDFKERIVPPTCTEKGYTLRVCPCTTEQRVNYVPALGHNLGEWVVTKPATEEAVGQETRSCSRCDYKENREIPKLEHTHKFRFVKTVKPTCTEKGYDLYTCSVCHAEEKRNLKDVIPHTFKDTVVKKTCTAEGYTLHKCSVCGFEEKSDFVPASHNFGEWICKVSGKKVMEVRTCADCQKQETRKHVHKYSEEIVPPTCLRQGYTLKACICGVAQKVNYVPALGHAFSDWTVTKPATEEAVGEEIRTCSRCNFSETREIPKLEHVHKLQFVETVKPTCSTKGYDLYRCACGYEEKQNITGKLPHSYKNTVVKPTCTAGGYTLRKCSVCGHSIKTGKVPALGHNFGDWVVTRQPTAQQDGVKTRTCSRCGKNETAVIPFNCQHTYQETHKKILEDWGYIEIADVTFTCSKCGHSYTLKNQRIVDEEYARGASKRLLDMTNEMRKSEGLKVLTSNNPQWQAWADLRAKEQVESFGHTRPDGSSWTHEIGYDYACAENVAYDWAENRIGQDSFYYLYKGSESHWKNMHNTYADQLYVGTYVNPADGKVCNAMVFVDAQSHQHTYQGQIIAPTCTGKGYELYTCNVCGESFTQNSVPALGHNWGQTVIEKEATAQQDGVARKTCTRCGVSETFNFPYENAPCQHNWKLSGQKVVNDQDLVVYKDLSYTCTKCGEKKTDLRVPQVQKNKVRAVSQELLNMTNNMRRSKGLKVLASSNSQWQAYADLRAREQAESFGHTRPDGSGCDHMIGRTYLCAENVAYVGGTTRVTGAGFYEQYKASEGHWKNMQIDYADELYIGTYVDPYTKEVFNAMVFVDDLDQPGPRMAPLSAEPMEAEKAGPSESAAPQAVVPNTTTPEVIPSETQSSETEPDRKEGSDTRKPQKKHPHKKHKKA